MADIDKTGALLVISGPAGSGKGTVIKELHKIGDYRYSISATTRKPRQGEKDGIDYYFVSEGEFLDKISKGEMIEYVKYSGNYYGTPREPVEKMLEAGHNTILEIEVEGAMSIKEKFPEAVMIFLTPPTYAELERRLRDRGTESEEAIEMRLGRAKKEIRLISAYDYLVINEFNMQKEAALAIDRIVETAKYRLSEKKAKNFLEKYL